MTATLLYVCVLGLIRVTQLYCATHSSILFLITNKKMKIKASLTQLKFVLLGFTVLSIMAFSLQDKDMPQKAVKLRPLAPSLAPVTPTERQ